MSNTVIKYTLARYHFNHPSECQIVSKLKRSLNINLRMATGISLESCTLSHICIQPRGAQAATHKPGKAPFLNSHLITPIFCIPVNSNLVRTWRGSTEVGRGQAILHPLYRTEAPFRSMVPHPQAGRSSCVVQLLP